MNDKKQGVILVVDDEEALRRAYARSLEEAGWEVLEASTGTEALKLIESHRFDTIVTDITMPSMTGIELLRAVRKRDLDVPVILVTGNPSVGTATAAVEYGALRYLVKPIAKGVLAEAVGQAVKLQRVALLKREAAQYLGDQEKLIGDRASLELSLGRGLETLWMAYQPIVNPANRSVVAYEALVRTREPSLPHPGVLLSVAERLDRVHDVGRAIRQSVANTLAERAIDADTFINLHSADLLDETLFAADSPLAPYASRIVLEITERVALEHASDVPERIRRLRNLGFRIAIDDLGAGYAGLSYFALLSPDVVKLDMSLVRNVHEQPVKQKLVGSMTRLCRELGMRVVAEGIETRAERDALIALEADLFQGYLFAKPGPAFPDVTW
ncbi:MAG TPA: EAL domain-containing protein [Polyangiaceae bacterium]|jgi:EAL domain-containing protein (putative c-di-GMP-specific phosphodiesterase class I)|nr:EAL domain-containing protein [Polyangiaceae bacterium]